MKPNTATSHIRDPIHGAIDVSPFELKVIQSSAMQRLRFIKQLAFVEVAFPGATHSRYAHSVGVMHMASLMFDEISKTLALSKSTLTLLRQILRLAALFHDLGHPPLSHSLEKVMPPLRELNLPQWCLAGRLYDDQTLAGHEDFTLKFILASELTEILLQHPFEEISPEWIASIVCGKQPPQGPLLVGSHGLDILPLLHQIVSGELDADRMDYLRRDAYYCGVSYGSFDATWLLRQLTVVIQGKQWQLALRHKAVWAFENFLLARYHMFLSVYYHHVATGCDYLLSRFLKSSHYRLPADIQAYLDIDEMVLWQELRKSPHADAMFLLKNRTYHLLSEIHHYDQIPEQDANISEQGSEPLTAMQQCLEEEGIDSFVLHCQGILSRYQDASERHNFSPLMIWDDRRQLLQSIETYTPLYNRFQGGVLISRLYCHPQQIEKAEKRLHTALIKK